MKNLFKRLKCVNILPTFSSILAIFLCVDFCSKNGVHAGPDCDLHIERHTGIKNCSTPGLFALTFDDGPGLQGGTKEVLDVLKEKGIKATFFVTGTGWDNTTIEEEEEKRALIKRIFDEGHQIGSHTWTHPNLIVNHTKEDITAEFSHIAQIVGELLLINMTIFRPPYGCSNETVVDQAEDEFGYKSVLWNLDTRDWFFKTNTSASFSKYLNKLNPQPQDENLDKDDQIPGVKNTQTEANNYIALHHDPAPGSGELARKVIDYVNEIGLKFVTVGECIGVPDYIKLE